MEKLSDVLFYHIDRSIKLYRIFAQKQIKDAGFDITIDQWLVLKCMNDNPDMMQIEVAEVVFKDNASVTRIIELLMDKDYLVRETSKQDRRRSTYYITPKANDLLFNIQKVINSNRKKALKDVSLNEMATTMKVLKTITEN